MLAIGQALASGPKVLMLDEPTTGLAPSIVDELLELIQGLCREGVGVLLVEQAMDLCLDIADHVIVVNLGQQVHCGPTSDPGLRSLIMNTYLAGEVA